MSKDSISRRTMLRVVGRVGASAALGGLAVAELIRRGRLKRVRRTEARLGTLVSVEVVHEEAAAAREVVCGAFDTIGRLEGILSRHDRESQLSRLNREGRLDAPDAHLLNVLAAAQDLSRQTAGAFDVTVGPLLQLYERAFVREGREPRSEEIRMALERVGYEALVVEGSTVLLERPGMAVTVDGIGKGYVVDQVVSQMRRMGIEDVLVDAGGDLASAGTQGGGGWPVTIQRPPGAGGPSPLLHLRGDALATSGDYMRAFTSDRTAHHIVDPRTGRSPRDVASTSVRAGSAMRSDALSTASMILGWDEGPAVLQSLEGVEGMVVAKWGETRSTTGWSV
ncbi:MAG: FAD:protein FMN transferase [Gemmatimonadetes bacterium]|nr:FAD:protein FMN transferase [Gemmatimonadota bacterium]